MTVHDLKTFCRFVGLLFNPQVGAIVVVAIDVDTGAAEHFGCGDLDALDVGIFNRSDTATEIAATPLTREASLHARPHHV